MSEADPKTRTLPLPAPFESNWIKVRAAIKMGTFVAIREKVSETLRTRQYEAFRECLALVAPLVVETNLDDVETGGPATFSFEGLSNDQNMAVIIALYTFVTGGGSADPLSSTESTPPISPGTASQGSRSKPNTPSGRSPAAGRSSTRRSSNSTTRR